MTEPRRPALWVELCCGSAAVTLRLIGGRFAVPPVSYIGSKKSYAGAILYTVGLRSGIGADAVVMVEAGPWAAVWRTLIDPATCAETARVLRSWAAEDPKALWDRLRADRPRGNPPAEAAAWIWLHGRSYGSKGEDAGFDGGHEAGAYKPDQAAIADRLVQMAGLRWPADPIRAAWAAEWIFQQNFGYGGLAGAGQSGFNYFEKTSVSTIADRMAEMPRAAWPGATAVIQADVATIMPPPNLPDPTFVYMDPPYEGVTGYLHDLPRASVIEVAQRWANAGAWVIVSEDDPLPIPGWHHVEITDASESHLVRTFSRSHKEWLTMSRPPVRRPMVQPEMFGDRPEASRAAKRKVRVAPPPAGTPPLPVVFGSQPDLFEDG